MSGAKLLLLGAVQQAVASDPYFENTTLLLPGNGTNGAQNNTFLDSSTNAFSITRNGNTTQGTFSPFSQTGWGAYFNGSSDYISVADSVDFTMGSGDFTIQCWVYSTANSGSDQYILGQVNSGGTAAATSFQLYKKATSNVAEAFVYAGATKVATGTAQIPVGQWTHLAMVRDGGTLRLYVNGSQDGTNATLSTTAITDSAGSFSVGRTGDYNGLYFAGYVSNVSVVKGTCLFPSGTTFTPSATPLSTSTSGQSVLLCQANRFIDTNTATTAKTVTVGSTSSIQAFSPFNPTAAWSAATYGGSGYFDGSGDDLTVANNAALQLGSESSWTVEFWGYFVASPDNFDVILGKGTGSGTYEYFFEGFSDNTIDILYSADGTTTWTGQHQLTPNLGTKQWFHFAAVRNGASFKSYVNGVEYFSGSSFNIYAGAGVLNIGGYSGAAGQDPNMYMSDLRIVKGAAVYTSNFTPPTAPLTAITNTSLLLNYTNAGIYDATSKNDLETVGNAQISTTQSKFGGSSMYFDGTGDYLVPNVATSNLYAFGSGDWTIEMWVYSATNQSAMLLDWRPTSTSGAYITWYLGTGVPVLFVNAADRIIGGSAIPTNEWVHLAICRASGSTKMFVNGTQSGSTYSDSNVYLNSANRPLIASNGYTIGGSPSYFTGYIQDLRITKGYARYTTGFTPPTAAFPLL